MLIIGMIYDIIPCSVFIGGDDAAESNQVALHYFQYLLGIEKSDVWIVFHDYIHIIFNIRTLLEYGDICAI